MAVTPPLSNAQNHAANPIKVQKTARKSSEPPPKTVNAESGRINDGDKGTMKRAPKSIDHAVAPNSPIRDDNFAPAKYPMLTVIVPIRTMTSPANVAPLLTSALERAKIRNASPHKAIALPISHRERGNVRESIFCMMDVMTGAQAKMRAACDVVVRENPRPCRKNEAPNPTTPLIAKAIQPPLSFGSDGRTMRTIGKRNAAAKRSREGPTKDEGMSWATSTVAAGVVPQTRTAISPDRYGSDRLVFPLVNFNGVSNTSVSDSLCLSKVSLSATMLLSHQVGGKNLTQVALSRRRATSSPASLIASTSFQSGVRFP
jgi:hypothetical protein